MVKKDHSKQIRRLPFCFQELGFESFSLRLRLKLRLRLRLRWSVDPQKMRPSSLSVVVNSSDGRRQHGYRQTLRTTPKLASRWVSG